MHFLRSWKAFSHSDVHWKGWLSFVSSIIGFSLMEKFLANVQWYLASPKKILLWLDIRFFRYPELLELYFGLILLLPSWLHEPGIPILVRGTHTYPVVVLIPIIAIFRREWRGSHSAPEDLTRKNNIIKINKINFSY